MRTAEVRWRVPSTTLGSPETSAAGLGLSDDLLEIARTAGAVHIQHTGIRRAEDVQKVVDNTSGLQGLSGYFMSEPGRRLVRGTSIVFHTSTLAKTGGTFRRPGAEIHTENYYSLDVPEFVLFWCERPSLLGGATSLTHLPSVARDLYPLTIQDAPRVVSRWTLADIASRYSIDVAKLAASAGELGLDINDDEMITLQRQFFDQHATDEGRTFSVNFGVEMPNLSPSLYELFRHDFAGTKWAIHRWIWRHPGVGRVANQTSTLATQTRNHPWLVARWTIGLPDQLKRKVWGSNLETATNNSAPPHTRTDLDRRAIVGLGRAIHLNTRLIEWSAGDLLLVHNDTTAHSGFPGFGPRKLRVVLCNSPSRSSLHESILDLRSDSEHEVLS